MTGESGLAQELERSFLGASIEARKDQLAAEEARQARKSRSNAPVHRLRALVAVFAVAALAAAGLTVIAFRQSSH